MKVDPVKERSGESALVAAPDIVAAGAVLVRQSESSAGAGVHGRNEEEIGRKLSLFAHSLQDDLSVLEGLAQRLECLAVELGKLVEEEDPMVCQSDLPRSDRPAAPHESHTRDAMMWLSEGSLAGCQQCKRQPRNSVNGHRCQLLVWGHGWENSREALGEHGLAGSGRAAEQQVVAAGCGDLQGALGQVLTLDVGEVRRSVVLWDVCPGGAGSTASERGQHGRVSRREIWSWDGWGEVFPLRDELAGAQGIVCRNGGGVCGGVLHDRQCFPE